jgi:hypothetical protein
MITLTTTADLWSVDPDPLSIRIRRALFEHTGVWIGRD